MTITHEDELDGLKAIGRIVANTMQSMAAAMEPGMTTAELDAIGEALLDRAGAEPAPRAAYGFPGATCISVNEEIAHGIPGPRVIRAGDLVNIDVSASKNGYYADTGASFRVSPVRPSLDRLCRDGRRAMQIGIAQVGSNRPLAGIGQAIGRFAARRNKMDDAADFLGWYMDQTERKLGISKWDAASQYLAYHEGHGGYSRGSHNEKAWLLRVAAEVAQRADQYQMQLIACGRI